MVDLLSVAALLVMTAETTIHFSGKSCGHGQEWGEVGGREAYASQSESAGGQVLMRAHLYFFYWACFSPRTVFQLFSISMAAIPRFNLA